MAVRHDVARMVLHDMRRDDLGAVLEIERRSFAQPWSRAFFEKELATPFARLVVAQQESPVAHVVGYTCRWRVTDEVHLLNVAVHPDRRGLGFGRQLVDVAVAIGSVSLPTPVIAASGTFGYGTEFAGLVDLGAVGAIAVKGLSLHPSPGKPTPRLVETPGGVLNA